ncbi:hypothetical protein [Massilia genomosp. 1]|uniref:HEAT repeat domain-containing protein n=1 Tax=Massilia genomosp. 1 TaxID=2609280 RepID=A0ABX0MVS9_9BURK|nr:hypothetical protein [Massilia genomosp. 1]NHZ66596.1 hypothetical protein [Massilia genomosp. 1]
MTNFRTPPASPDPLLDLKERLDWHGGRVREATVRECGRLSDPRVLALLAPRLNDWVPQVRDAAREAMMSLVERMPAAALLAILPRVQHLLNAGRTDHRAWVDAYEQALIRVTGVSALLQGVQDADCHLARTRFHLLRRHAMCTPADLVGAIGRNWNDVMLAAQGVRLCMQLPPDQRNALCRKALASPFSSVRTLALQAMLETDNADSLAAAHAALLDFNESVRAVAKPFMALHGVDLRDVYRKAARRPERNAIEVRTALAGLASLRDPADLAFMQSFTTHASKSVRAEALMAWLQHAPGEKDDIALAALMDASRTVRKLSLYLVCRRGAFMPMALVKARLAATGDAAMLADFARRLGKS